MESGSGPQSPSPSDDESPKGPQSPAPESPQSSPPPPAEGPRSPAGPQSPAPPAPGPQSPGGFAPPPPPGGPQSPPQWAPPAGSQPAPPPPPGGPVPGYGGTQAPGYGGPVPPGGWQQPLAQPSFQPAPGQLASWGSRVGATLLDWLIVFVPIVVVVIVIAGVAAASSTAAVVVGIVLGIATIVALVMYAPYTMAREGEHNGQTLGKQIVNIRVVRDNGQAFDMGQGFLREFVVKGLLFGTVGSFFLYIPTLLDWLWPLWDDQDRALHDMVVTTHVVRTGA